MTQKTGIWANLLGLLALAALLASAGCSRSADRPVEDNASWQTHRSDLDRNLQPDVTTDDLAELIQGNHELALELYSALSTGEDNLLLSPLSIRTAFAMVYAGARGETDTQMAQTLRYTLGQSGMHDAFNALDLELGERNDPGNAEGEVPIELYIANALWGRTGFPFREDYLDLLGVNYGSGLQSLDFAGAPEASRRVINTWVADQTRERIQDLLPPGSLRGPIVAVLTNALYLKAPWAMPFNDDMTSADSFHLLDGRTVTAPMMRQTEIFSYVEGDGYQALEMTYRKHELSMVLLLPRPGRFAEFESSLDAARLQEIMDALQPAGVVVTLPKFTFASEFRLKETLRSMGMVIPFTPAADFTGIVTRGGIWIDEAYHKTFIGVDEKGTEAAAATAVVMREISIPNEDYEFTADRPFLFLIRDRVTGAILFFGRLLNPAV